MPAAHRRACRTLACFVVVMMAGANTRPPHVLAAADASTPESIAAAAFALYEEGLAAYREKRYTAAIAAFERALSLDERPEILFALAQAVRLSGDCPRAVALFERFLASAPPQRQVEAASIAMKLCADRVQAPPAPPPPARVPATPALRVREEPQPPAAPPADHLVAALTLGGAALAIVGAALVVTGHERHEDATVERSYGEASRLRRSAEARVSWGIATSVLGAGLFAVGAGRYVWLQSQGRDALAVGLGGAF